MGSEMCIRDSTLYILVWPAIVAVVLLVLSFGFIREYRAAKKEGRDIV